MSNKVKKFLEDIRGKSEREQKQVVWLLTAFSMVIIFCAGMLSIRTNFLNLGKSRMDLSGLPPFPAIEDIDFEAGLSADKNAETEKELKWKNAGDEYLQKKDVFGNDDFSSLKFAEIEKQEDGSVFLKYEHYYKDILVLDSSLILMSGLEDDEYAVSEYRNNLKNGINIAADPAISMKNAFGIAEKELQNTGYVAQEGKLAIAEYEEKFYLVWRVVLESAENGNNREILVGAKYGSIISSEKAVNQTSDITE